MYKKRQVTEMWSGKEKKVFCRGIHTYFIFIFTCHVNMSKTYYMVCCNPCEITLLCFGADETLRKKILGCSHGRSQV